MTQINLSGVIGWDVDFDSIRAQFEGAGDIELIIHSPGGEVYDGIAIHNLIRNHRRAGNRVDAKVTGLAASMATYIAMAADSVAVEDNVPWMVHNPWTISLGDYRTFDKEAKILDSLTRTLANSYAEKTGRTLNAVREEMDTETWLYGDEIVKAGYADSIIPAGDGPEDKESALAYGQTTFGAMRHKLRSEKNRPGIESIAAMLPPTTKEAPMGADNVAATGEPQVDLEVVEIEEIDIDSIVQAAIGRERERVAMITKRCADANMPHMAQDFINSGANKAEVDAALLNAFIEAGGAEVKQAISDAKPASSVIAQMNEKLLKQMEAHNASI